MKPHKPKVLFFPFDLLSHYSRCVELSRSFGDKYELLFKSSSKYNSFLTQESLDTFICSDFDADFVMACVQKFSFKWLNREVLEAIFLDQVRSIQQHRPLFIVGDMSSTLKMAAEYAGTPLVSVINGYMSKYYALQRPVSATHWAARFQKLVAHETFAGIVERQERKAFVKIHKPFREIRKKFSLLPMSHYFDELEGDNTLICDDPKVFPQRSLPASYNIIGPLLYASATSPGRMPPKGRRKNILVTFGSSGDWRKVACINDDSFARFNIVTVGDAENILAASHVTPLPFSSFNELLPDTDLLICHGGNGTLNYAYKYKVPFLALPSIMEQEWNASRFKQIGTGEMITTKKLQPSDLLNAILHILASSAHM
jgi:UDP:flavonoid glycosyltransferase YjiC (YdhE family)